MAFVQYRLLQKLETGGASQLWEAVDTRTGRRVAIQRPAGPPIGSTAGPAEWAARVEREAHQVARLSHPNIAAVHDAGIEDNRPFLVLEMPSGRTLSQRLRLGPVPVAEAGHILGQAASALDALHTAGISHGNLTAANFLLGPEGAVTLHGLWADAAGPRPDLPALGAVLAEMVGEEPPPPIQAVVSRALSKDPAAQYPSAGALAAAFEEALADPMAAALGSPRRVLPLKQFLRPILALLAGLAVIGLLALAWRASRPPPPTPPLALPVETTLPIPQTPPTPSEPAPDSESPFTPGPPRPVRLPEPPPTKPH